MPNRWIKTAYCDSERIEACCPPARDLWVRLLLKADDYGRLDGRLPVIASNCFPLQKGCEQLLADVSRLLDELERADLVRRYEVSGKSYIFITRWYERPRSKSKFPEPPEALTKKESYPPTASVCNCAQVACNCKLSTSTTTTTTTKRPTAADAAAPAKPAQEYSAEFEELWRLYPKRDGDNPKVRAYRAYRGRLTDGHTAEEMRNGVIRYAAWIRARGMEGTDKVKQTATFLGPDKGFLAEWDSKPTAVETNPLYRRGPVM